MPGTATSAPEVTNISKHGLWLLVGDEKLLVSFKHFPWFLNATIEQVLQVEWSTENHLYWPLLDVDLSVESIRDPAAFPFVSRGGVQQAAGADVSHGDLHGRDS